MYWVLPLSAVLLGVAACSALDATGRAQHPQESLAPADLSPVLTCPPAPAACRDFQFDQLSDPHDPDWKLWI